MGTLQSLSSFAFSRGCQFSGGKSKVESRNPRKVGMGVPIFLTPGELSNSRYKTACPLRVSRQCPILYEQIHTLLYTAKGISIPPSLAGQSLSVPQRPSLSACGTRTKGLAYWKRSALQNGKGLACDTIHTASNLRSPYCIYTSRKLILLKSHLTIPMYLDWILLYYRQNLSPMRPQLVSRQDCQFCTLRVRVRVSSSTCNIPKLT